MGQDGGVGAAIQGDEVMISACLVSYVFEVPLEMDIMEKDSGQQRAGCLRIAGGKTFGFSLIRRSL